MDLSSTSPVDLCQSLPITLRYTTLLEVLCQGYPLRTVHHIIANGDKLENSAILEGGVAKIVPTCGPKLHTSIMKVSSRDGAVLAQCSVLMLCKLFQILDYCFKMHGDFMGEFLVHVQSSSKEMQHGKLRLFLGRV